MESTTVDDAIASQSLASEGGQRAAKVFENVDTSHKVPVAPATKAASDSRTSAESADFTFAESILRLGPTQEADSSMREHGAARPDDAMVRRISLIDAVALTIGLQVGSGIFSSPGIITADTGSVGMSIVVWLLSGALAYTGACSYAELATAIPLNGGPQAYLQYSLGPVWGFLYSWTTVVALKPSSGAIIATILGEYAMRTLLHLLNGPSGGFAKYEVSEMPSFLMKGIACSAAIFIFFIQIGSVKFGTRFQLSITIAKIVLLYTIPVIAVVFALRGAMPPESKTAFASIGGLFSGSSGSPSRYALALYSGLWAFDGWEQCTFVTGEMRNPSRDVPRTINMSALAVTGSFVITVIAYFLVLAPQQVAASNTVALDFGAACLGLPGGIAFAAVVALSCLGAINGHLYTYVRLISAAGREGFLPEAFARVNSRTRTPVNASLLGVLLIIAFIVGGSSFASLVNFCGVCSWFWYGTTVLGLLVLRVTEPDLNRPYKVGLWIATCSRQTLLPAPILFVAVTLFLLSMPIVAAPLEALAAFLFIGSGIPLYLLTQPDGRRRVMRLLPRAWRPTVAEDDADEMLELAHTNEHDTP